MKATQKSWTLVILTAAQALVVIAAVVVGLTALVVLIFWPVKEAEADPYVRATGGCIWSSDQSNDDELEFGSECGALVSAEGGYRFNLTNDLALDAGLEAAHRVKALHGQNGKVRDTSADGETLNLTSLMVNVRPSFRLFDSPVSLYGEAGAGGAHLRGLDNFDLAPAWQLGAGVEVDIWEGLSAHAGYRHFEILDAKLDGNRTGADFHGAVVGIRWTFLDGLSYRSDLLED